MKDEFYEFIKGPNNKISIVGFGSYGEVKLAKNIETGEIVAIKMIHGKNAKDEIDVHHKLNHSNIIKLMNYYYEKERNITFMVLEFAEGGSLNDKIKFGYGHLGKDKVKKYFRDICKAVEYLHSHNYMHRDIKPENILLTKDDSAKLCDFGFAAILEYRNTLCGTHEYMAPEMIQEKPYDYKVDVWALGILLFELIQGTAPFRGETGQDIINEMRKPITFSQRFGTNLLIEEKNQVDLIKKILRVNSDNRPTVKTILEHPYFKDDKEKQVEKNAKEEPEVKYTQPSRTITSKPSQLNIQSKVWEKPMETLKKQKSGEFKHFVPQSKSNFLSPKPVYSNIPTSPNSSTNYQGLHNYSSLNQPSFSHSTSMTFLRQNAPMTPTTPQTPSSYQKNFYEKGNSTVGYGKTVTGTQPSQVIRNSGSSNYQPSSFISSWRKH